MMDRRRFLLTSLAGALAAPLGAGAQQAGKMWRLGFLTSAACPVEPSAAGLMLAQGLRQLGHVVGKTVVFECRASDEGREERFHELAAELVHLKVDLIIGVSSTATRALRPATSTIPIVALDLETDPVGSGLAVSLARPGGNITGIFLDAVEMNGKRLQLLKEVVPRLSRVAALWDATLDAAPLRATATAARSLDFHFQAVAIRSPKDFEAAFRTVARERADGVILLESPLMRLHQKRIVDLALKGRLPTVAIEPRFVQEGGLMSYGPDVRELFQQSASFVDRILKGTPPGQLPIERPTRFYLVVNLKTAKALGLTIPPSLLGRADQVIE